MNTKDKVRKRYEKPQVSQVKLEVEEAVLTACKRLVTDAAKAGTGQPQCGSNACKTVLGS